MALLKKCFCIHGLVGAQPLWVLQAGFAGFTVYFKVQIWGFAMLPWLSMLSARVWAGVLGSWSLLRVPSVVILY